MESIKLEAQERDKKESVKQIIESGSIPAVLYGPRIKKSKNLKVRSSDMEKVFAQAGESTLIDLAIDGKDAGKTLIKDSQKHLTKDTLIHIDFYEVDMDKEIHTEIPLRFLGESKAVKEFGGVLIKSIDEIEVECLPKDLVNHIGVDISNLDTFNDVIKLADVKLPPGIKLVHEIDAVVANVAPPREEEEEIAPEEEAPAEGEAPAEEGKDEEKTEEGKEKTEEKKEEAPKEEQTGKEKK